MKKMIKKTLMIIIIVLMMSSIVSAISQNDLPDPNKISFYVSGNKLFVYSEEYKINFKELDLTKVESGKFFTFRTSYKILIEQLNINNNNFRVIFSSKTDKVYLAPTNSKNPRRVYKAITTNVEKIRQNIAKNQERVQQNSVSFSQGQYQGVYRDDKQLFLELVLARLSYTGDCKITIPDSLNGIVETGGAVLDKKPFRTVYLNGDYKKKCENNHFTLTFLNNYQYSFKDFWLYTEDEGKKDVICYFENEDRSVCFSLTEAQKLKNQLYSVIQQTLENKKVRLITPKDFLGKDDNDQSGLLYLQWTDEKKNSVFSYNGENYYLGVVVNNQEDFFATSINRYPLVLIPTEETTSNIDVPSDSSKNDDSLPSLTPSLTFAVFNNDYKDLGTTQETNNDNLITGKVDDKKKVSVKKKDKTEDDNNDLKIDCSRSTIQGDVNSKTNLEKLQKALESKKCKQNIVKIDITIDSNNKKFLTKDASLVIEDFRKLETLSIIHFKGKIMVSNDVKLNFLQILYGNNNKNLNLKELPLLKMLITSLKIPALPKSLTNLIIYNQENIDVSKLNKLTSLFAIKATTINGLQNTKKTLKTLNMPNYEKELDLSEFKNLKSITTKSRSIKLPESFKLDNIQRSSDDKRLGLLTKGIKTVYYVSGADNLKRTNLIILKNSNNYYVSGIEGKPNFKIKIKKEIKAAEVTTPPKKDEKPSPTEKSKTIFLKTGNSVEVGNKIDIVAELKGFTDTDNPYDNKVCVLYFKTSNQGMTSNNYKKVLLKGKTTTNGEDDYLRFILDCKKLRGKNGITIPIIFSKEQNQLDHLSIPSSGEHSGQIAFKIGLVVNNDDKKDFLSSLSSEEEKASFNKNGYVQSTKRFKNTLPTNEIKGEFEGEGKNFYLKGAKTKFSSSSLLKSANVLVSKNEVKGKESILTKSQCVDLSKKGGYGTLVAYITDKSGKPFCENNVGGSGCTVKKRSDDSYEIALTGKYKSDLKVGASVISPYFICVFKRSETVKSVKKDRFYLLSNRFNTGITASGNFVQKDKKGGKLNFILLSDSITITPSAEEFSCNTKDGYTSFSYVGEQINGQTTAVDDSGFSFNYENGVIKVKLEQNEALIIKPNDNIEMCAKNSKEDGFELLLKGDYTLAMPSHISIGNCNFKNLNNDANKNGVKDSLEGCSISFEDQDSKSVKVQLKPRTLSISDSEPQSASNQLYNYSIKGPVTNFVERVFKLNDLELNTYNLGGMNHDELSQRGDVMQELLIPTADKSFSYSDYYSSMVHIFSDDYFNYFDQNNAPFQKNAIFRYYYFSDDFPFFEGTNEVLRIDVQSITPGALSFLMKNYHSFTFDFITPIILVNKGIKNKFSIKSYYASKRGDKFEPLNAKDTYKGRIVNIESSGAAGSVEVDPGKTKQFSVGNNNKIMLIPDDVILDVENMFSQWRLKALKNHVVITIDMNEEMRDSDDVVLHTGDVIASPTGNAVATSSSKANAKAYISTSKAPGLESPVLTKQAVISKNYLPVELYGLNSWQVTDTKKIYGVEAKIVFKRNGNFSDEIYYLDELDSDLSSLPEKTQEYLKHSYKKLIAKNIYVFETGNQYFLVPYGEEAINLESSSQAVADYFEEELSPEFEKFPDLSYCDYNSITGNVVKNNDVFRITPDDNYLVSKKALTIDELNKAIDDYESKNPGQKLYYNLDLKNIDKPFIRKELSRIVGCEFQKDNVQYWVSPTTIIDAYKLSTDELSLADVYQASKDTKAYAILKVEGGSVSTPRLILPRSGESFKELPDSFKKNVYLPAVLHDRGELYNTYVVDISSLKPGAKVYYTYNKVTKETSFIDSEGSDKYLNWYFADRTLDFRIVGVDDKVKVVKIDRTPVSNKDDVPSGYSGVDYDVQLQDYLVKKAYLTKSCSKCLYDNCYDYFNKAVGDVIFNKVPSNPDQEQFGLCAWDNCGYKSRIAAYGSGALMDKPCNIISEDRLNNLWSSVMPGFSAK